MQGIEILSKTEIFKMPELILDNCRKSLLIAAILAIALVIYVLKNNWNYISFLLGDAVMIFILITMYHLAKFDSEFTGRYRYECKINDSVSFNEINDKYDIIEQNGKIIILEDKEITQ